MNTEEREVVHLRIRRKVVDRYDIARVHLRLSRTAIMDKALEDALPGIEQEALQERMG